MRNHKIIMGRVVFTSSAMTEMGEEITIDISNLQSGMYYLKIGNETVKIIKQ